MNFMGTLPRKKHILTFVTLAALVGLVGFLWWSYTEQKSQSAEAIIPIIAGDTKPYKVKPENPGGAQIAHKDSVVFDALRNIETDANVTIETKVEEEAEDVGKLFAGLKTDIKDTDLSKPETVESLFPDKPKEQVEEKITEAEIVDVAPQKEESIEETQKPKVKPFEVKPEIKVEQKQEKVIAGTHYIQIAAVGFDQDKEKTYTKLKSKYGEVMGNLGVRYKEFKNDKGHFWRIQVGPQSKEQASKTCDRLKSAGGSCYLVAK